MAKKSGFIGVHISRKVVAKTFRFTVEEVWDAIYYGELAASHQFTRKDAPAKLSGEWAVVVYNGEVPDVIKIGGHKVRL